jgi:hypothetical protein
MMATSESQLSSEQLAQAGTEVFNRKVRPALRAEHEGKFVAIDIGTGDYEIDDDDYAAVTRLRARHPSAEVWLERAGHPTAYQMRQG